MYFDVFRTRTLCSVYTYGVSPVDLGRSQSTDIFSDCASVVCFTCLQETLVWLWPNPRNLTPTVVRFSITEEVPFVAT